MCANNIHLPKLLSCDDMQFGLRVSTKRLFYFKQQQQITDSFTSFHFQYIDERGSKMFSTIYLIPNAPT